MHKMFCTKLPFYINIFTCLISDRKRIYYSELKAEVKCNLFHAHLNYISRLQKRLLFKTWVFVVFQGVGFTSHIIISVRIPCYESWNGGFFAKTRHAHSTARQFYRVTEDKHVEERINFVVFMPIVFLHAIYDDSRV